MDNPFKPQNVNLVNYHPEHREANKIKNISENVASVRNTRYEKPVTEAPQVKTFKDAVPLPKSYGDVYKPDHYSDHIDANKNNQNHQNNGNFFRGFNGFKNN